MDCILSISDKDIFPKVDLDVQIPAEKRIAVKVVIYDFDKKIALVGTRFWLLPGGGVENGEDLIAAAERECLEEVGCKVEIENNFCMTKDVRFKRGEQETYFFTAHLVGEKGLPQTTQADEQGLLVRWVTLDEAVDTLRKEVVDIPFENYNSCFNVRTHLAALEFLKNSN